MTRAALAISAAACLAFASVSLTGCEKKVEESKVSKETTNGSSEASRTVTQNPDTGKTTVKEEKKTESKP